MIIFYDLDTTEIRMTEDNTMVPILPVGMEFDEKIEFYKKERLGIIALPYEIGSNIYKYEIKFNDEKEFIGLIPKGK